jgi:hypothetical protein
MNENETNLWAAVKAAEALRQGKPAVAIKAKTPVLSDFEFDFTAPVTKPTPLVAIRDNVIFYRCSMSVIAGKAKARKSTLSTLLAAKFLIEDDIRSARYHQQPTGKVLYFDTEQPEFWVSKNRYRICSMLNWQPNQRQPRYRLFQLRRANADLRAKLFTQAVETIRPDLVFLDNVQDLIHDKNNQAEVNTLLDELMRLSDTCNCHICSILHENRSDNHPTGLLGVQLVNKADTVMSVKLAGTISQVNPYAARSHPFEQFEIGINDDGLPYFCDYAVAGHPALNRTPLQSEPPVNPNRFHEPEKEDEDEKPF